MIDRQDRAKQAKANQSRKTRDPRLAALDEHIAEVRAEQARNAEQHETEIEAANRASFAFSTGFRLSAEVVGGVVLGILIGLCVDWVFSSSPLGLSIFVPLGFAAGVLNLVRQLRASK